MPGGLDAATSLVLRPLVVRPHAGEFLVGDPPRGEFVLVPEIAIAVIEAIRAGQTLGQAAETARERAGQPVDVFDFAGTLLDLGFVAQVDGTPVGDSEQQPSWEGDHGGRIALVARPLFSPPAWGLYGALFVVCTGIFVAEPRHRPRPLDAFLLSSPLRSTAALYAISLITAFLHEGAHWLAARVEGAPARITLSRRFYLLVFETDLTALWAKPRWRRLGPLLAGLACDTVLMSILITGRIAADADLWHPPTTVEKAMAAWMLVLALGIGFQFIVFLRTDLYGVLTVLLGTVNLTRVARLVLTRSIRQLTPGETAELATASPRDLQVARWYRWIYLAGMALAGWFFAAFFVPWISRLLSWTTSALSGAAPGQLVFWEALILGCLALMPLLLTIVVFIRERDH